MAELFSNFEVNRESRWRILLRLIGASLALHLAFAALVIYVPTFRDAFNIAFLASKTNFVDRAYNRTFVGDDVQMIEVGGKFRYPDGYFATGVPEPTPVPLAPQVVATFTPPPRIVSTPLPIPSPLPSASASAGSVVSGNNSNKSTTPAQEKTPGEIKGETAAETKTDDVVLGVKENEFNTRPLKDWLGRANALREKGVLDLSADLELTIDARLNGDCKLEDPKVVQKSGDQMMVDVAKDLAAAISDSRMLLFLRDPAKVQQDKDAKSLRCDPMTLRFTVKLDQSDFNATVQTEADSADRAAQLSRGYNLALVGGEISRRGKEEEAIFKNTKVTSEGKQIVVHFKMPRTNAAEMLKKQIEPKPAG